MPFVILAKMCSDIACFCLLLHTCNSITESLMSPTRNNYNNSIKLLLDKFDFI